MLTRRTLDHYLAALGASQHVDAVLAAIAPHLPPDPDAPLLVAHLVLIVLGCISTPGDNSALRLSGFVGDQETLGAHLVDDIERMRSGLLASATPMWLRYHVGTGGEFVAIDHMHSAGTTAPPALFLPQQQLARSPGALQIATEVALPWLFVRHLAEALGPDVQPSAGSIVATNHAATVGPN